MANSYARPLRGDTGADTPVNAFLQCMYLSVIPGNRYDFDVVHPSAKVQGLKVDCFFYGQEPIALLLLFGDLKSVRAGIAKMVYGYERMLTSVQSGSATADGYASCAIFQAPRLPILAAACPTDLVLHLAGMHMSFSSEATA